MVLLIALLGLTAPAVFAQDAAGTVRGVVVDARDGSPLRQVSVRLQAGKTTLTGDDGRFELTEVPAGTQELYVSVINFMLVKRTIVVPPGGVLDLTIPVAPGTGTYTETVTVRPGNEFAPATPAVSEQTLPSSELQQLRGLITNDPFRAVQSLPGVASGDDLRSEFTVRGFAVDHMNFTFEGVPAPLLVHTVQGIHDSGSIAMVNGDILDDIVLSTGSYPQHFGGRTGAELDFRLREGSRDRVQSHVSVSFTDAAVVVEGPLGRAHKGSWLASIRKSYLDRLIKRLDPTNDFAFGFSDVQTRLVYDLNSRHQVQLALTAGRSRLDRPPEELDADDVKDGRNATAIGVVTWRFLASPKFILTQKVSGTANAHHNTSKTDTELARGKAAEALYRGDWSYAPGASLTLDGGAQVGWSTAAQHGQQLRSANQIDAEDFSASAMSESAFVEARLPVGAATVTGGGRVDHWALTGDTQVSPWLQMALPLTHGLMVRAGGGIYRQEPGFLETRGRRGTPDLTPEHAVQMDAAIEGRFSTGIRWQVSGYNREDRDLIRLPNSEFRIVNGRLVGPSTTSRYQNRLDGHSRGTELLIQRRSSHGLSGWVSYALSYTKYRDGLTGETFWGDWDQRHTVNAYGSYRFGAKFSASSRFRYGSNFPTTGYWEERNGQNFVSTVRNELRVSPYSRLDVRANRTFDWGQKRLTLYVELINVLGRNNVRFASAGINTRTFEAFGLFDDMFPRIPSVGFLLEF